MAELAAHGAQIGIGFGAGYAAAIALQYAFQLRWTVLPALTVLLTAAFVMLAAAFLQNETAVPQPTPQESCGAKRTALPCAIVITIAMLVFISYFNMYIHHLQVASGYTTYTVYTWPRLLMIPGVLLLGLLGDLQNGRFLPAAALSVVVLAQLNAVLAGEKTHLLNMCLYYLALTAAVSYYHLTFLRLAPRTGRPAIWASAGRILDSAVVVLSFFLGYADFSAATVLLIDIAALVVTILLMAVNGDFDLFGKKAASAPPETEPSPETAPTDEPQSAPDPFPAICARYRLTPAEMNVLRELVLTDDKQEAIAEQLHISVSTLRHHITSIYRKTDAQSRAALCKLAANQNR